MIRIDAFRDFGTGSVHMGRPCDRLPSPTFGADRTGRQHHGMSPSRRTRKSPSGSVGSGAYRQLPESAADRFAGCWSRGYVRQLLSAPGEIRRAFYLVGGTNYGQGSTAGRSRWPPRSLGLKAVIPRASPASTGGKVNLRRTCRWAVFSTLGLMWRPASRRLAQTCRSSRKKYLPRFYT